MAGYIPDGYERSDGFIAASPVQKSGERLYDALSFTYRVATRQEVIRHDAECRIALKNEDNDPECVIAAERLACKFVAAKLKLWDLKDQDGKLVPCNADSLMRVNPALFAPLYRIIRGVQLSDPKPENSETPLSDDELAKNSLRVSGDCSDTRK